MLPKMSITYRQERLGITAVASAAAKMGLIWRETNTGDIGIDGQFEFVGVDGVATGQLVGVQVKAGPSYFENHNVNSWHYYPEDKHRHYWERYPLPVILILHDPDAEISYWADVRQALRRPDSDLERVLSVPKVNVLQKSSSEHLFATAGIPGEPFISNLSSLVRELVRRRSLNASFPISYFDLFTRGLTNICRSIYFGMDLAMAAAEENTPEFGVSVGKEEHEFLFGFISFLISQNLADINYSDCLVDWHEQQMQPHFVAPLTSRGRALVSRIGEIESSLVTKGYLNNGGGLHVAQEGFFEMLSISYSRRIPRIVEFQRLITIGKLPDLQYDR
ncbi:MAG: DUF4365 domain-containing protein [Magnetococcales bacterium]|nr:DUF4365 domain-containing protein [Magnetococcales bacterium]MBF0116981.1 DUF4365 domain-containing protein [Magnetococcales bacterium]